MAYSGLDVLTGEVIDLDEAQALTHAYQQNFPLEKKAFFVGAARLKQILDQEGCIGIRIYGGYDEAESKNNLVLVGVNFVTQDMTDGTIVDRLVACPGHCDATSPLIYSI
ncbi:hypothetical protein VF12_38615 [Nostoc linckia z15]|jgi:hypothetical protein|nr:hypothetical protein VF12_38615 [Nostoc linckia z15]